MTDLSVTTSTGTTISLVPGGATYMLVILDNPGAPADMRNMEAGRVSDEGFQPAPFAEWGLSPEALRGIADLIEQATAPEPPKTTAR